jgi:hypothetical protein
MSDSNKKPVPGGRSVVQTRAYCEAWRKYGDVVTAFTGWHGDWTFERIARLEDRAHAIRAAEVRLYAEQHQARVRWHAAKVHLA